MPVCLVDLGKEMGLKLHFRLNSSCTRIPGRSPTPPLKGHLGCHVPSCPQDTERMTKMSFWAGL